MKTKFALAFIALTTILSGAIAQASRYAETCYFSSDPMEVSLDLITSTTLPPITTTTVLSCVIINNAELNNIMIQREATMVAEENKVFVPSFLGAYADQNKMEIREAAQDVLVNGIR